jgi:hypothetical protein
VNVTIEYAILVPLLFAQIIIFPFVASTVANSWQETQRNVALQEVADHLASTIQQLYLTINNVEISAGNINQTLTLPETVGPYPYTATCSLNNPPPDSAKILTVTLTLDDVGNTATGSAIMGNNVEWAGSFLRSNAAETYIEVEKSGDTLTFGFGG